MQQRLVEFGIGTLIHYPIPPHRQQAYADAGFLKNDYPLALRMADEVLSLPIGPHLGKDQIKWVIDRARSLA